MKYKHIRTKENGDATSNYDIVGEFPIRLLDFMLAITEDSNSFRIEFHDAKNWTTSKVEVKERDGEWYITEETLNDFMKRYKDKMVVKCWANGGYGQMSYFCT